MTSSRTTLLWPSLPVEVADALAVARAMVLHVCCAVCASKPIEDLLAAHITPLLFFYNPNIDTPEEYKRRKDETTRLATRLGLDVVDAHHDVSCWNHATRGLETEPEGGMRCERCFELRLGQTAQFCASRSLPVWASTLGISPHKDQATIDRIGQQVSGPHGVTYWPVNWRKNRGVQRMFEIARQENMYRQNYCGCRYSRSGKS